MGLIGVVSVVLGWWSGCRDAGVLCELTATMNGCWWTLGSASPLKGMKKVNVNVITLFGWLDLY